MPRGRAVERAAAGWSVPRTTLGADFFTDLIEALAELPAPVCLILDNAHHLHSEEVLHGLGLLLRHRPPTLRLVLSSRFDPALPIARLRLEGRLCEVRTEQLGFSPDETADLAERCGLDLSERQIAVLHQRTAGWVAGIRLAAMPLRGHEDPDAFLAAFSGDDGPVADYLAGEVLAHISDDEADVLRRISIADPVPAALAAELSGRADAPELLSRLGRSTGLVLRPGAAAGRVPLQELMRTYLSADLGAHGTRRRSSCTRRLRSGGRRDGRPARPCVMRRTPLTNPADRAAARWAPTLVAAASTPSCTGRWPRPGRRQRRGPVAAAGSAQLHLGPAIRGARAERRAPTPWAVAPGTPTSRPSAAATRQLSGMAARSPGPGPPADAGPRRARARRGAAAWISADRPGRRRTRRRSSPVSSRPWPRPGTSTSGCWRSSACACSAPWRGGARTTDARRRPRRRRSAAAASHGWQDSWWTATASAVLAHARLMRAVPARRWR